MEKEGVRRIIIVVVVVLQRLKLKSAKKVKKSSLRAETAYGYRRHTIPPRLPYGCRRRRRCQGIYESITADGRVRGKEFGPDTTAGGGREGDENYFKSKSKT